MHGAARDGSAVFRVHRDNYMHHTLTPIRVRPVKPMAMRCTRLENLATSLVSHIPLSFSYALRLLLDTCDAFFFFF